MRKTNIIWMTLLLILPCGLLPAQKWLDMWQTEPGTYTYWEIRAEFDKYFETHEKTRGTYYKQFERWAYYMEPRVGEEGQIQDPQMKTWQNYLEYLRERSFDMHKTNSTNGAWTFFGSQDHVRAGSGHNGGIGRINVIRFHPTNSNIIFAGAPAGGLWKTTNGGSSWAPLTDGINFWGVSGIAVHPTNANIIYVLTGDGDGGSSRSAGVWKTTNGGSTWAATGLYWDQTGSTEDGFKLLMDPSNANVLYCVTSTNVYKTSNAGVSWSNIEPSGGSSYRDMEFKPGSSSTIYLSGGTRVYRSTNSGSTWVEELNVAGAQRIALGVTPANSNYVYALCGPATGTGSFKGVYRSTNSGASFSLRGTSPNILGYDNNGNDASNQSWYDLAIAVSPTNANEIHTGGINCWKSTDGGLNFSITSKWIEYSAGANYTHADIHELVYNGNTLYCGSDGGVYRSTNPSAGWTDIGNGLAITEFYRFGGTPQNAAYYVGGAQDNGTNIVEGPVIPDLVMTHVEGADGMEAAIDPTNQNIIYGTIQNGKLIRSTNKGSSWSTIQPTNLGGGPWVTPYVLKPGQPTHILAAYNDVGVSTNSGSTWTNLSNGTVTGGTSRAVAYAPSNTNYIYVVKSSKVWKSTNGGSTWTDITSGLGGSTYTYIAVNPTNPNHIFVTRSTYASNSQIFESTNGGSTWTNISGTNLPNVPANCVVYEPGSADGIYLGTDVGVFYKDDNLTDWIDFSTGLPFARVMEMEINPIANRLRAATYGRSIWESDLYGSACATNLTLTGTASGTQTFAADNNITSTQSVAAGANITYSAGNLITLNSGFNVPSGATFGAIQDGCNARTPRAQVEPITGTFELNHIDAAAEAPAIPMPEGYQVGNYPNPFRNHTWITYELADDNAVSLLVYDLKGQLVATIAEDLFQNAGTYTLSFDADDLPAGQYILRYTAGNYGQTHMLQLVR